MKALIKKLGEFSLGPLFAALIGFITVPLITHIISPEEYARASMFTLAQTTVALFLCLGMDQAFVREFHESDDRNKLLSNAMLLPVIFTVLLDVALLCFRPQVSMLLFDTPDEDAAIYALALLFPSMLVERFALMKLRMEEKGLAYSLFTVLLKLLTLVFTLILLLHYEKSFRSVIYALSLAEILCGLLLFFTLISRIKFSLRAIDRELMARMLRYGLPLLPASALMWILTSMDKAMLRTMSTYTELGLYAGAFKIVSALSILQTCFTLFWTPLSYRWYQADVDKRRFSTVMQLVAFGMSSLCLLLLLAKDLVALVLGSAFASAIYIFPFIMLHPIMYTMSETTVMGISFQRRTGNNIVTSALAGAVNIALNLLLIPVCGAQGAAVATGISYIVFFWARTLISRSLWWAFPVRRYVYYTLLILLNCTLHTFMTGWIPYAVSAVSLVLTAACCVKPLLRDCRLLKADAESKGK